MGCLGCVGCFVVTDTAQVELRSERVQAHALNARGLARLGAGSFILAT